MPVYLFTFHAYRSWGPDHPRGFVQKDRGVRPTNMPLAQAYDKYAKYSSFFFDEKTRLLLLTAAREICAKRCWRLHAMSVDSTHAHLLVSWNSQETWQQVRGKLKNLMALILGKSHDLVGRPWFSQGGSRKRVTDMAHLTYLVEQYLPRHKGLFWRET